MVIVVPFSKFCELSRGTFMITGTVVEEFENSIKELLSARTRE
jgi:hypothetical protein